MVDALGGQDWQEEGILEEYHKTGMKDDGGLKYVSGMQDRKEMVDFRGIFSSLIELELIYNILLVKV